MVHLMAFCVLLLSRLIVQSVCTAGCNPAGKIYALTTIAVHPFPSRLLDCVQRVRTALCFVLAASRAARSML